MDIIEILNRLVQTDVDAVQCYAQAIESVDDATVATTLRAFRADHLRHIDELSDVVREHGGTPPDAPDVSGILLSSMTGMASSFGVVSALGVMETNEVVTNGAYDQALAADLPESVRAIVLRNRDDERRHLRTIMALLERHGTQGRIMRGAAMVEGGMTALWMNRVRYHTWTALLLAGAAGVAVASLWPRRQASTARPTPPAEHPMAEAMAEPPTYPGYRPPGEQAGHPLH